MFAVNQMNKHFNKMLSNINLVFERVMVHSIVCSNDKKN